MAHPSAERPAHTDKEQDTDGRAPLGRRFITL